MIVELSRSCLSRVLVCFLLIWLSSSSIAAHPFTYSICKLYIGDQYISGNLEVSAENLLFFNYLNLDSTNNYTRNEILDAAKAYRSLLSKSILIKSAGFDLNIEDFRLSDFSVNEQISISELKETFIHYTFKIKIDQNLESLNFMHKIGDEYPLISSLLILEIEGRDIEKTFDNLDINKLYEFSFKEKKKVRLTSLLLESGKKSTLVKLSTSEAFLEYAVGGIEKLREEIGLLGEIIKVRSGDFVVPFSDIGLERTSENAIEVTAEIQCKNDCVLEWKKFNMDVKSIPSVIISEGISREFTLSRYEREVRW